MRDIGLTLVLALVLTFVVVKALALEVGVGVVGITFAMCVLVAGVLVRITLDWMARRKAN
jgi:hypothetical protein